MKPPVTREGITRTLQIGADVLAVTVNPNPRTGKPMEIFCRAADIKTEEGERLQGHLDRLCTVASLGLQGRATPITLIRHLLGDKTPPLGIAGQPSSIYDGFARILAEAAGIDLSEGVKRAEEMETADGNQGS